MFRVIWGGAQEREKAGWRVGEWQDLAMLLENHGVGKALSVLFMCRRASSLAHSANGEPALGVGRGRNGPSQVGLGPGHTPTSTMPATTPTPTPLLAPLTLLRPSPNPPACSPERIQAWPMTEESSGSPRSRRWRAGGEVIGIAGCGSRK